MTVVHGIPDTTVDVYVNDELTLDDFTFTTVTEPLSLPAGDYAIAVRAGDAEGQRVVESRRQQACSPIRPRLPELMVKGPR